MMKYDFIVIGAGSGGGNLAARLSESPDRSVLLLEAGPDYPEFQQYPDDLKFGYAPTASEMGAPHNWSFTGNATSSQPDPIAVPRGKVVGGTSAINGQVFLRGVPEDYDNWAAWGNDEWRLKALEYPNDRARLREAVRIALQIMKHKAFENILDVLISPTAADLASDETLDVWMLQNVWIGQHLSGTCKMGPDTDPMAVVDQYGRVRGFENLRIADASIMPNCIRANTNLTTIMIGERIADWLN